jgi:signal transduction histidine kinase
VGARTRGVVATVVLVLVLTAIATVLLFQAEQRDQQARLDSAAEGVESTLQQEFERLLDLGTATQAALDLVDELDPERFATLMDELGVPGRYPTLASVAVLEVVPRAAVDDRVGERREQGPFELREDAGEDELALFTYAHPPDVADAVLGIDLTSRPESFLTLDRALETGAPRLSSVTQIIQLEEGQPGASLHIPLRLPGTDRPATLGIVVAGQRFLDHLAPFAGEVNVQVLDRDSVLFPVFAQVGDEPPDRAPRTTGRFELAGRTWDIVVTGGPGFVVPWHQRGSTYLGAAGLVASLLLGMVAWSNASRERYARELARRRTRELVRVNEELAEVNRYKDEFIASVSHELRTPLTVIAGFAQMLERVPPEARSTEMVVPIQRNVRRLSRLVDDLLTLASLDAGGFEAHPEAVDLEPLLTNASWDLAGLHPDDVEVEVAAGSVAWIDPRHAERIVTNLLTNAAQHGAPPFHLVARPAAVRPGPAMGSRDRGTTGDEDRRVNYGDVEVVIRDHGPGVADAARSQLFSRFARGQEEVRSSGTGLGLAIVRELVELAGGQLTYEPASPGARFVVRLPGAPAGDDPGPDDPVATATTTT